MANKKVVVAFSGGLYTSYTVMKCMRQHRRLQRGAIEEE